MQTLGELKDGPPLTCGIPIIPLQVQKNKEYRQKRETLIRERKRAREHAIEIDDD